MTRREEWESAGDSAINALHKEQRRASQQSSKERNTLSGHHVMHRQLWVTLLLSQLHLSHLL